MEEYLQQNNIHNKEKEEVPVETDLTEEEQEEQKSFFEQIRDNSKTFLIYASFAQLLSNCNFSKINDFHKDKIFTDVSLLDKNNIFTEEQENAIISILESNNVDVFSWTDFAINDIYLKPESVENLRKIVSMVDVDEETLRDFLEQSLYIKEFNSNPNYISTLEKFHSIFNSPQHDKLDPVFLNTVYNFEYLNQESQEQFYEFLGLIKYLPIHFDASFNEHSCHFFETKEGGEMIEKINSLVSVNTKITSEALNIIAMSGLTVDDIEKHETLFDFIKEQKIVTGEDISLFLSRYYYIEDQGDLKKTKNTTETLEEIINNPEYKKILEQYTEKGFSIGKLLEWTTENDPEFGRISKPHNLLEESTLQLFLEFEDKIGSPVDNEEVYYEFFNSAKNLYSLSREKDKSTIIGIVKNEVLNKYHVNLDPKSFIGENFKKIAHNNIKENFPNFFYDESLPILISLGYNLEYPDYFKALPEEQKPEALLLTARSLHFQGIHTPSHQDFKDMFETIIAMRMDKEIRSVELFHNKNVFLVAGHEILELKDRFIDKNDSIRFGNPAVIQAIQKQNPQDFKFFQMKDQSVEESKNIKSSLYEHISSERNISIILDGHGSGESFILSSKEVSEDYKDSEIDYTFFVEALKQRHANGLHDRPVFILNNCFSYDFAKKIHDDLQYYAKEEGISIKLPIIITQSELGQYAYSNYRSRYHNTFLDYLFNEKKQEHTNIGDVFDFELNQGQKESYNVSVFMPEDLYNKSQPTTKKIEKLMQIAEHSDSEYERGYINFLKQKEEGVASNTFHYFEAVDPLRAQAIKQESGVFEQTT